MYGESSTFDLVSLCGQQSGEGVVGVFVCYLDDSDSAISQVATLGGYVASIDGWKKFESETSALFEREGVDVYQTKRIIQSKGAFASWSMDRKRRFIEEWSDIASKSVTFGVAVATRRSFHRRFVKEFPKNSRLSAMGVSFSAIMHIVCSNNPLRDKIRHEGISFVIESGHKNNPGLERFFHEQKGNEVFAGAGRSITFVDKNSSRAIQWADFCAYHARRILSTSDRLGPDFIVPGHELFDIAYRKMPHLFKSVSTHREATSLEIDRAANPAVSNLWQWLTRPH